MPGTVKSGLLSDADKSYKCDSQEKVCWILNLPLDKGHFITECLQDTKSELKEIEDTFIIQNGGLYLKSIKVRVIEKYKDTSFGRLLEPGEIMEVAGDRAEQLLEANVVEKI